MPTASLTRNGTSNAWNRLLSFAHGPLEVVLHFYSFLTVHVDYASFMVSRGVGLLKGSVYMPCLLKVTVNFFIRILLEPYIEMYS